MTAATDIRSYPHTRTEATLAQRIVREFAQLNADALISDGQRAVNEMVEAVERLRAIRIVDRAYLIDVLAGLLDQASSVQHDADRQLDDVGLEPDRRIDVSEAAALLGELRQ